MCDLLTFILIFGMGALIGALITVVIVIVSSARATKEVE